MNIPENKTAPENDALDPKKKKGEPEAITNNEEANKVVNKDGVSADMEGIEETLNESSPSPSVEQTTATDADIAESNTATDAEIAGDDKII
ncbi:hypothetical protein [Mucilaginibacter segetis]|uniref:Uncharacterized protein n=1 Tax=Mucilaginibacter segetis TaxID=2793071 RepID=A0A934UPB4_9SPHI|nr:hypothetical protein [Mucilaginibacter segetis]MBK0381249.1 hypothetical protein [Mucilaginibacter segetis]